jgi:hypothetical protein
MVREAEKRVSDSHGKIIKAISKLVKTHKEASNTNNLLSQRKCERQIIYLIHKSEFLHPSGNQPHHNVSKDSFSFYEYLKFCCAEAVTEQIEIPTWIYCISLFLLLIGRPVFSWQGGDIVLVFVILSMVLAICFWVILRKLVWIQRQLVPRAEQIPPDHHKTEGNVDHHALADLKPVNNLDVITSKNFVQIRTLLYGTCSPSPHEQLFWFHRRGPAFINNSLRLLSFILAIFLGEWLNHMISFPYTWQNYIWSIPIILLLCGTALVTSQDCIVKAVVVISTELMPRQDVINKINHMRSHERQRYHKDLLEHIKIQAVQRNVFVTLSSGHKDWLRRYNNLPQPVQQRIHKTWTAFDQDHSGSIDRMELKACLHSLGKQSLGDDGTAKWMKALGVNADEYDEGLSQQQFRVMMAAMHEAQHAPLRKPDAIAVLAGIARLC